MPAKRYIHVDVFSPRPYSGNSLAVFLDATGLDGGQMAAVTKELRHFESIFLESSGEDAGTYSARVFDLNEELDFAGHPLIGAACALHDSQQAADRECWTLRLKARTVTVETERRDAGRYFAVLDQGPAEFLGAPELSRLAELAAWFSLSASDLDPNLPPEIVSTGLRYLVLPVRVDALAHARIARPDLDRKLGEIGAQFAYLLNAEQLEGRHWNNDGVIEDVATGSGAGCAAAYLRRHARIGDGESVTLEQGRFVGRPSEITMRAHGTGGRVHSVEIGGQVSIVGEGQLFEMPV
ncbi:MAG: PhzF family phenazine biosynthesis protein [Rhodanobacteraceae bacterium]